MNIQETIDRKLYNARELAEALGVKPSFIRALARKGFKMPLGVSTPARVHAFLAGLENDKIHPPQETP